MPEQRTLARSARLSGTGIHSGHPVTLVLEPAPPGHGIVFVARADDGREVEIPARREQVAATTRATTLARDGASVATVEHLLAAASALGIDNLRVALDGGELPVGDGSAVAFCEVLREAGAVSQGEPRQVIRVLRPVRVEDGERMVEIEPASEGLGVDYTIDFPHPGIGRQHLRLPAIDGEVFHRELARARTFGFLADLEALRAAGLAGGAGLENTIVLDEREVVNPEGLRWPDEFVRHKVVDLLGDLALLGAPLVARVRVERGGHALHRSAADRLWSEPDAWRLEPSGA